MSARDERMSFLDIPIKSQSFEETLTDACRFTRKTNFKSHK